MGLEIERKFLVKDDSWKKGAGEGMAIRQGFLNSSLDRMVRVRVSGDNGYLTIKGRSENLTRKEFEYEIPVAEAISLIELCEKPLIEKTRYLVTEQSSTWEIDVFDGENKGLIIAEVELRSEDQALDLPGWVGEEVSADPRYYNASLISHPYVKWKR